MKLTIKRIKSFIMSIGRESRNEEGWTFFEVLVVLAIILILSGTVAIAAFQNIAKANVASARDQIQIYSLALNAYAMDNNAFPSQTQGLQALRIKPSEEPVPQNWRGPYIEKNVTNDPWGTPYQYQVPGPSGLPFGLLSLGADKQTGGEGDNADISSWE
jgi:general secretion pathway protein G